MPSITLSRAECESADFPAECIICGGEGSRQTCEFDDACSVEIFLWGFSAPWLCFLFPPLFVMFLVFRSRFIRVDLPICYLHRHYWIHRRIIAGALALSTWCTGTLLLHFTGKTTTMDVLTWVGWVMTAILLFILGTIKVRAESADGDQFTLLHVHPDFVAAVEAWRDDTAESDAVP